MYHLIILVGLPGSGKTYLGKNKYNNYIFFDDYLHNHGHTKISDIMRKNHRVIIACPYFCDRNRFQNLILEIENILNVKIDFIFFENNLENCLYNLKDRPEAIKTCNILHYIYNVKYFLLILSLSKINYSFNIQPVYKYSLDNND